MFKNILGIAAMLALAACSPQAKEGEACTSNDDCEDGLECHMEKHEEGEDHSEEDHADEKGVCEKEGAHDDEKK